MKNSLKLAIITKALLLYLILFYTTSIFAETFNDDFDVKLGGKLTIQTDTGSVTIDTYGRSRDVNVLLAPSC
jgi:hypothetical protein